MYAVLAAVSRRIHGIYGICTYIYHQNQPSRGKYTSSMDPMGSMTLDTQNTLESLDNL